MNRKEFLTLAGQAIAGSMLTVGIDAQPLAAETSGGSTGFRARTTSFHQSGMINFPPEKVFPLLCPVREYEWIDGWKCEMIHSVSGVAEEGCVFKTSFSDPLNPMTWVCSRYEPPRFIQYIGVVPGELVMRLSITVERSGNGTVLSWNRAYTGISESGNERVAYWQPEWDAGLTGKIEYFLKTGKKAESTEGRKL